LSAVKFILLPTNTQTDQRRWKQYHHQQKWRR